MGWDMPRRPADKKSPRYKARIGYEGEYSLIRKFIDSGENGCYAVRTPGSGSGKMAKPDIIAVDHGELLAIEVKSSNKNYAMLDKEQIERLLTFVERFTVRCPHCSRFFNPRPVFAIRFLGRGWRFVEINKEDRGKNSITVRWRDYGAR